MNQTIIDDYAEQANLVNLEILGYVQRPSIERDEVNEGQIRRLRVITAALNSALFAVPPPLPVMPAPPPPVEPQTDARKV